MLITPNLSLPYIDVNAAQREVVHNEAIRGLDVLAQLAVLDRHLATPPGSPSEGQRWIVAASPTGAWSGHATEIAAWQDGAWRFYPPRTGWLAFVMDEGSLLAWNGSAWVDALSLLQTIQNVLLLGVGTTADATNPFSAKLNNALWTAKTVGEGGDGHLRYKMNKESTAKTLSLLMQTNFSGRAEFGLTGDDDLHVKVSPDGSTWHESLIVSRSSGKVGFGIDGSASAPALTWASDPDNGLYRTGTNAWSLACAGAQAIGIAATAISIPYTTASTSTTTGALTVAGGLGVVENLFVGGTTFEQIHATWPIHRFRKAGVGFYDLSVNGTNDFYLSVNGGSELVKVNTSGDMTVAGTTASTSTTTGALTVAGGVGFGGDMYVGGGAFNLGTSTAGFVAQNIASRGRILIGRDNDDTVAEFRRSSSLVGSISVTATNTLYNISSDRDRKCDARAYTRSGAVIDALKIWDFAWKDHPDQRGIGVYAQEAYEVFPDAITPAKHRGGWQADYSKFVPVLIAEMQDLRRRLATVEAKGRHIREVQARGGSPPAEPSAT